MDDDDAIEAPWEWFARAAAAPLVPEEKINRFVDFDGAEPYPLQHASLKDILPPLMAEASDIDKEYGIPEVHDPFAAIGIRDESNSDLEDEFEKGYRAQRYAYGLRGDGKNLGLELYTARRQVQPVRAAPATAPAPKLNYRPPPPPPQRSAEDFTGKINAQLKELHAALAKEGVNAVRKDRNLSASFLNSMLSSNTVDGQPVPDRIIQLRESMREYRNKIRLMQGKKRSDAYYRQVLSMG